MAQPRTRPRQEQATIEQMDRLHEQVMRQIPNLPDSERHALIRVYQQMWMRSESPQQAPRPRAPESGQLSGPLTDMVRLYEQEFNRIQGLPQGQRAAAMRDLMGRSQAMWDDAEHAQSAQPQVPRRVVTPAPRRVASYVYEIEMGGARYRVSLPERLPTAPNGRVNVAAARARLHDLLLTNQLVGPGGSNLRADVQMLGTDPVSATYNHEAPNTRLDRFRDRFLTADREGANVTIAALKETAKKKGG
ncbi:MAG: hypothetical protein U0R44_05690 [Candidatus Micrarchaeia archaeon]